MPRELAMVKSRGELSQTVLAMAGNRVGARRRRDSRCHWLDQAEFKRNAHRTKQHSGPAGSIQSGLGPHTGVTAAVADMTGLSWRRPAGAEGNPASQSFSKAARIRDLVFDAAKRRAISLGLDRWHSGGRASHSLLG